ncbi:MAG: YbhB/YbcL family Raf kinase inhibitor-like protein [Wenzhouxiangellaceae bacterium]|nr:YbhB/YbcL family Raf kinase inhibitor-like protein [Wenzhouxiangellaceae bacterium]
MRLESSDLTDGAAIDPRFAFGKPDADEHMALSENLSPHLAWSEVPTGTRSFAVLCVDPDVPSVADDVNQEGKTIPVDLARVDFFHWVMIDVPAGVTELVTGQCSEGVTPGGKQQPPGPTGSRQGLNNYTQFLAGAEGMAGRYFGYDGPCPPWNDARLHHYRFTVYALDVERLDIDGDFDGPAVLAALDGHVLGQASITGTYSLNPALR